MIWIHLMPKYWCDFPRRDFSKHDWYIIVVPKTKTIALVVSCVKKSSGKMEIRAANNIVQSLLLLQGLRLPSSSSVVLCWRVLKLCAISLSRPLQLEIFSMLKFVFSVRGILPACRTLRIWRPLNFWVGWVFSGVTGQISNKGGQLKALYLYFCK